MLICACSRRLDWPSNPMSHLPFRPRWPPSYALSREGGTHKKTPPRRAAFKGKPGRRAAGAPAPVERLLLDEADLLHLRVLGLGQHLGEDAVLGLLVDVDLQCRLVVDVALDLGLHHVAQRRERRRAVIPEDRARLVDPKPVRSGVRKGPRLNSSH